MKINCFHLLSINMRLIRFDTLVYFAGCVPIDINLGDRPRKLSWVTNRVVKEIKNTSAAFILRSCRLKLKNGYFCVRAIKFYYFPYLFYLSTCIYSYYFHKIWLNYKKCFVFFVKEENYYFLMFETFGDAQNT